MMLLAGLVHVPYDPLLILGILGWRVPGLLEAGMVLALGLVMLGVAIWELSIAE